MLIHSDTRSTLLLLQLRAHDEGGKLVGLEDSPTAKAARDSEENYQRVRKDFEAKLPTWKTVCDELDDFKDQNVLFLSLIGAMLTFLGFQLGKRSERNAG